jgi:hypothetical protein
MSTERVTNEQSDKTTDAELLRLTDYRRTLLIAAVRESARILEEAGVRDYWKNCNSRIRGRVFDAIVPEAALHPMGPSNRTIREGEQPR